MFTAPWVAVAPLSALIVAAVAAAAYWWGRHVCLRAERAADGAKLKQAAGVIRQLDEISQNVRRSLAAHHASVIQFRERLGQLGNQQDAAACQALAAEAERMLPATLDLSRQLARAYDEVRQQTNRLMAAADVETDSLTGLYNRRGLEEVIASRLALKARYDNVCSLALFDIDDFQQINERHGRQQGDVLLRDFAALLARCARETDTAARFDGEEFVVVLPETDLAGACVFAERVRKTVQREMGLAVSGGVATVAGGDTPQSLLSRADTALYSAKSAGRNRVFRHCGRTIEPVDPSTPGGHAFPGAPAAEAALPAAESVQ